MVHISDVRASNASFKSSKQPGLVALFVGATRGIGLSTLKHFTRSGHNPSIYIVGRSQSSFSHLLEQLKRMNPEARLIFIETDISLIRNVDRTVEQISLEERKIDILFMSPGWMKFGGRIGMDIHPPSP